jgi:hypothetical protein
LARSKKLLTADLRCWLMPKEKESLEGHAVAAGLSVSQWIRQRLLEVDKQIRRLSEKNGGLNQ